MPRRRGERTPVYVEIANGLKYGFQTTEVIHNQYKSVLGQTTYAGAAGVFFGCNSPKPNQAKLETTGGSTVSSFCSNNKIKDLRKAGWTITAAKSGVRGVKLAGPTRSVYVDMPGGYRYAWNLTASEVDQIGVLGIELASGSTEKLVWGSDPKPPRASKKIGGSRVSTFIKPQESVLEAAVNAGWSISSVSYALIPAA